MPAILALENTVLAFSFLLAPIKKKNNNYAHIAVEEFQVKTTVEIE